MVTGLPSDGPAAPVRAAVSAAAEVAGKHIPDGVVVPQHEREIILMQREIDSNTELVGAYAADADRLSAAKGAGSLSTPGAKRLAKLEKALGAARATDAKLMAKAKTQVAALGGATPPCAGVAFVTFNDANDAVRLLQQGSVALPALGPKPFKVQRPPEPSDVLWENLGCKDGAARQVSPSPNPNPIPNPNPNPNPTPSPTLTLTLTLPRREENLRLLREQMDRNWTL